jgi:arginine N-succinyltransferase
LVRGVIDEAGGSPFWDGVAGRFFGMSFQDADEFNGKFGNQFIADLMPKHPVYIAMLGEHAKNVIGVPHVSGRAAMRMLEDEGFAWENYVDIFDGGPTMTVRTDQIKSVRDAKDAKILAIDDTLGDHMDGDKMLITHGRLGDFKATYGWVKPQGDGIALDPVGAGALGLSEGDNITYIPRS